MMSGNSILQRENIEDYNHRTVCMSSKDIKNVPMTGCAVPGAGNKVPSMLIESHAQLPKTEGQY